MVIKMNLYNIYKLKLMNHFSPSMFRSEGRESPP